MENYTLNESSFRAPDGESIYYRSYRPKDGKVSKVVVYQHGYGEHSGRYENMVNTMANTGYAFYGIDARGHGQTKGPRGHVPDTNFLSRDLSQLIDIARKNEGLEKVTVLGHSMGTLIVVSLLADNQEVQSKLSSVVLSGFPIKVNRDLVLTIKAMIGAFLSSTIPGITLPAGIDVNLLSRDESVVKAYQDDPLVHGWISAMLGDFIMDSERMILPKASNITIPCYIFHGAQDQVALPEGSKLLFAKVSSKEKVMKIYDNLYHETMNELPADREKVLKDLKDWLLAH
jgi:lysophospholipase